MAKLRNAAVRRASRASRLFVVLVSLSFTAACLDSKVTLTVYPSGAGSVRIHEYLNPEASSMVNATLKSNAPGLLPRTALGLSLYTMLGSWQGMSAWSNCQAGQDKFGGIYEDALGYFDDISQVALSDLQFNVNGATSSFRWTQTDGAGFHRLDVTTVRDVDRHLIPETFPTDPKELDREQLPRLMTGLRIEFEVVMPGKILSCVGCTGHRGRSGSIVITDGELLRVLRLMADDQRRVSQGQMTSAQADAAVAETLGTLFPSLEIVAPPTDLAAEYTRFQQDFAKARVEYATSGVAQAIAAAKTLGGRKE